VWALLANNGVDLILAANRHHMVEDKPADAWSKGQDRRAPRADGRQGIFGPKQGMAPDGRPPMLDARSSGGG